MVWLVRYTALSQWSSVWNGAIATASEMAASMEFRFSHCLHTSWCLWSHCCRRSGLVQTLRANTLQWLATSELVLIRTCEGMHLNALHLIPVLPWSVHWWGYLFNWSWVKENKGKNRVRLKQYTITISMEVLFISIDYLSPSHYPLLPYQNLIFWSFDGRAIGVISLFLYNSLTVSKTYSN